MTISSRIRRLYAPDQHHVTRWHNARGERLPLTRLPDLARAVRQRLLKGYDGPWMNFSAVQRLESMLGPDVRVLELGGGRSSDWLAARCQHVTTVEDDPRWAQIIRSTARQSAPRLEVVEERPADYLQRSLELFDVAIVDDIANDGVSRLEKLRILAEKGIPHIVLDDSDRWSREDLAEATAGYRATLLSNWRPAPLHVVETAFFDRTV